MSRPVPVLAGNRRVITWTATLDTDSAPLSTADLKVLRVDIDGTVTEVADTDIDITDIDATTGKVAVTVRFDDDTPRGRVTFRLDVDSTSLPELAEQVHFLVEPAAALRL